MIINERDPIVVATMTAHRQRAVHIGENSQEGALCSRRQSGVRGSHQLPIDAVLTENVRVGVVVDPIWQAND